MKGNPEPFLARILEIADDKLASDARVLEVCEPLDFTDYLVLLSGNSDRHVKAISSELRSALADTWGQPVDREGEDFGRWIILDYDDVVIHVLQDEVREYFNLDELWSELPQWRPPEP